MRLFKPLALVALAAVLILIVGCERKVVNENKETAELTSCFTCHADNDSRLLKAEGEWANSAHASGTNVDYTNRANSPCAKCHQHQGFVDYVTTGVIHPPYENAAAIHCFTCHAPHSSGTLALRTESAVTLANAVSFNHGAGNLCANCHQALLSAATITDNYQITTNRWGPHHGTQADMVNGTNGFEIDGYDYEITPHATQIDGACVGCHMADTTIHDGYKVGGHSFNMIDEESGSNLSVICKRCHTEAKSFDYDGIQTDVEEMLGTLQGLLIDAGLLALSNGEYLPNVATDDTLRIADKNIAGALYNYMLIEADRSEGVHNPAYIRSLLENSIDYLQSQNTVAAKSWIDPAAAH